MFTTSLSYDVNLRATQSPSGIPGDNWTGSAAQRFAFDLLTYTSGLALAAVAAAALGEDVGPLAKQMRTAPPHPLGDFGAWWLAPVVDVAIPLLALEAAVLP
jgi:hypothetical protein